MILVDSLILYAHIGTGSAGGLTSGESARSLAQPAWRGGVFGCGFPNALFTSQTEEVSESLRYAESKKSTSGIRG